MKEQIVGNKIRTVVLLVAFAGIAWALAYLISAVTGRTGLLFVIGIFSLVYAGISYYTGPKMALAVNRAKQISRSDNPTYWDIVKKLAAEKNLPMPKVYIMEDPSPNAFATGRDPAHSAICATSGLLQIMNQAELEGVLAHELGHIQNYDMRVNTLAFALVGVISLIADFFLQFTFWGGSREENNNGLAALALVAAILAPVAATLMQLAISRRREYLADATGAQTTHNPNELADALEKIKQTGSATRIQNTSTAHMFFANPLPGKSFLSLFQTHPPIDARIKVLREMKL